MKKYFTEKQIYASTFFGGPIPPGILIYKNFKNLGEEKNAIYVILFTLIFTVLLFYGLFQLPDQIFDKLPSSLITSLYTVIVYLVYHKYFAKRINAEIVKPENKMSNWTVAGLTFLGLSLNMLIIAGFAFSQPAFPGEKIEYGKLKHEIFYNEGEINKKDIEEVGYVLTYFGYFNDNIRQSVKVEKKDDYYVLLLLIQKEYWSEPELLSELNGLKYF